MTGPRPAVQLSEEWALRSGFVDSFMEAKLHWPPLREDWLPRTDLVDRLDRASRLPVSLVAAPAGFGKTILLAQWLAERNSIPAAWVSLDAGDNDPGRLWAHVVAALERAGHVLPMRNGDPVVPRSGQRSAGTELADLVNALAAGPNEILILLDDFHFIHDPACHAQVQFLIENLPPQAHLVITTRTDPSLRLGRVRASGRLVEIRAEDLRFTAREVDALLAREGVHLSADAVAQLHVTTEGWPTGVYLAALSLRGRPDPEEFASRFSGTNRFVGDYLTEEVLSRHSAEVRDFILTMSILERLSADLCDFVGESSRSARILRELERTNLFLVPLDLNRVWFRFHHLFTTVAHHELETRHPDRAEALHARAARWFRDHGHIDEAFRHLLAAGERDEAALLVRQHQLEYLGAGRQATVLAWLQALGAPSDTDPALVVASAWTSALVGDEASLGHHLLVLDQFRDFGPLPDGTRSVESAIAMIQGLFGFGGPAQMMAAAQRAVELETDERSPNYAIAHFALGHTSYVTGDLDRAELHLAKASQSEAIPAIIRVLSLSVESFVRFELAELDASRSLALRAMEVVDNEGLRAVPQSSMAMTALGQVQAADGQVAEAMATLEMGLALRRENPASGPWPTIHHFLVMARVAVAAGQPSLAGDLLAEVATRMGRYGEGMNAMRSRLIAVREDLRLASADVAHTEPLTSRELDVLRLLQGPLSLGAIARELYLSFNTVKTHTQAIYRKTGTHSRKEAVASGRRQGLI